jgi:hypothetical protein
MIVELPQGQARVELIDKAGRLSIQRRQADKPIAPSP